MYIPKAFVVSELTELRALIEHSGVATLVCQGEQGLQVSHLPLVLGEGEFGTLYGHVARANPQWRALATGAEVLVVLQGSEAYVSPCFYREGLAASAQERERQLARPWWPCQTVHEQFCLRRAVQPALRDYSASSLA